MAAAIRQEFLGRLESLKLRAASSAQRESEDRARDPADPVVLVARIEDRRLVLPWEGETTSAGAPHARGGAVRGADLARRNGRARPRTAACRLLFYRRALSLARHPAQAASAELLVARALGKAGHAAEALEYSRKTMARPLSLVDEHRVPFTLYAARRVADLEGIEIEDARVALDTARRTGDALWVARGGDMAAAIVSTLGSKGPSSRRSRLRPGRPSPPRSLAASRRWRCNRRFRRSRASFSDGSARR